MNDSIQYQTLETDKDDSVTLTPEQRQQLIDEKLERYRLQSEMNYKCAALLNTD